MALEMNEMAKISSPSIFQYECIHTFIKDKLQWLRTHEPGFTVSTAVSELPDCSASLVSRVAKGIRQVTRDRVMSFAKLLRLNEQETYYFDQWIAAQRRGIAKPVQTMSSSEPTPFRKPRNHLLTNWLNVYVKDLCRLKRFKPNPSTIYELLDGIAKPSQIRRSLAFLLREGFLKYTESGKIVQNNFVEVSTHGIVDKRIATFHRKALELSRRSLTRYPLEARSAMAHILVVNKKDLPELKRLLRQLMEKVVQFGEERTDADEHLYQVLINLSPVSRGKDTESC